MPFGSMVLVAFNVERNLDEHLIPTTFPTGKRIGNQTVT
jgi:hypothetical protein